MWLSILTLVIFLSICVLVVDVRAQQLRRRALDLPDETISSPFSKSLSQLIGIAGGIYLSLVMLTSFLKIETPEKIAILGIMMEPLAFIAVIFALCQPFIIELYERFKQ